MSLDALRDADPIFLAFVATVGTYLLTALGTLPVLFFKSAPRRLMDGMMGFAAGVMVAASCWSLLVPAIDSGGVGAATLGLHVAISSRVGIRAYRRAPTRLSVHVSASSHAYLFSCIRSGATALFVLVTWSPGRGARVIAFARCCSSASVRS